MNKIHADLFNNCKLKKIATKNSCSFMHLAIKPANRERQTVMQSSITQVITEVLNVRHGHVN